MGDRNAGGECAFENVFEEVLENSKRGRDHTSEDCVLKPSVCVTGRGNRRRAWGSHVTQRGGRWLSSPRLFPSRFGSVSARCYRCVDCFRDS